ncbi:hypothetical protein KDRO_A04420 [Kluyveromyces lactis]|nr:hypothetical protein KDRO_A04420 [Kluyveromyces lactis]
MHPARNNVDYSTKASSPVPMTTGQLIMLHYDSNNKQLSLDNDSNTDRLTNLNQINKLTTALVPETNPNFQPHSQTMKQQAWSKICFNPACNKHRTRIYQML